MFCIWGENICKPLFWVQVHWCWQRHTCSPRTETSGTGGHALWEVVAHGEPTVGQVFPGGL